MTDFPIHFDPSISCMLDDLCVQHGIPNSWNERSKAQAVLQHYWKALCLERGLDPDQCAAVLPTHTKTPTTNFDEAYSYWVNN